MTHKKAGSPGSAPGGPPRVDHVRHADRLPNNPPKAAAQARLADIKVSARIRKDMGDIDALAADIAEIGLLQPIVVSPEGKLLAGERRLRAAKKLGWETIDVIVRTER
jgi:hypothetical protein